MAKKVQNKTVKEGESKTSKDTQIINGKDEKTKEEREKQIEIKEAQNISQISCDGVNMKQEDTDSLEDCKYLTDGALHYGMHSYEMKMHVAMQRKKSKWYLLM